MKRVLIVGSVTCGVLAPTVHASFITYKNDKQGWIDAVGASYTTLDFNFGQAVILSDQYESLGVLFPEPDDNTWKNPGAFPNDGWGVKGGLGVSGTITVQFLSPQNWLAFEYPGLALLNLYYQDKLIFSEWGPGAPVGGSKFFGIVSTSVFDKAVFSGGANIDDLYFGAPVPAPPGLAVFALARGLRRSRGQLRYI